MLCAAQHYLSLLSPHYRSAYWLQVQARISQVASQTMTEAFAQHTFQPHICRRSMRITQHMDTDFQARQQQHLLRRHRKVCNLHWRVCNLLWRVCNLLWGVCNLLWGICNLLRRVCNLLWGVCNLLWGVCNLLGGGGVVSVIYLESNIYYLSLL